MSHNELFFHPFHQPHSQSYFTLCHDFSTQMIDDADLVIDGIGHKGSNPY